MSNTARIRKLKSGEVVTEHEQLVELPIRTHCPEKWLAIDLETGHVWQGSGNGWKHAAPEVEALVASIRPAK